MQASAHLNQAEASQSFQTEPEATCYELKRSVHTAVRKIFEMSAPQVFFGGPEPPN